MGVIKKNGWLQLSFEKETTSSAQLLTATGLLVYTNVVNWRR